MNFAGNLVTRQGYAEPFFRSNVVTGDPLGRKTVLLVDNVDDFRLPAVTSLDARIEKKFTFGKAAVALDFDVFNVLNSGTVLGNQYDVATHRPDRVRAGARDHESEDRAAWGAVLLLAAVLLCRGASELEQEVRRSGGLSLISCPPCSRRRRKDARLLRVVDGGFAMRGWSSASTFRVHPERRE